MAASFVTTSDGIDIAYEAAGEGRPVVLIHGFGASRVITWSNTGWCDRLIKAGHRVIAVDCRGHGESGKPHDPEDYDDGRMAADIMAVLADQSIPAADIMGYSMGGQITIRLMCEAGGRLRRAVLGGVGERYFRYDAAQAETIAQGLLAREPAKITDPVAKEFRTFCEKAGNDLVALAACMRRPRRIFTPDDMSRLPQPVLVVCGEDDKTSGRPEPLAEAFAKGQALAVPKRNHHSTVGDKVYKDAVVQFLTR